MNRNTQITNSSTPTTVKMNVYLAVLSAQSSSKPSPAKAGLRYFCRVRMKAITSCIAALSARVCDMAAICAPIASSG